MIQVSPTSIEIKVYIMSLSCSVYNFLSSALQNILYSYIIVHHSVYSVIRYPANNYSFISRYIHSFYGVYRFLWSAIVAIILTRTKLKSKCYPFKFNSRFIFEKYLSSVGYI